MDKKVIGKVIMPLLGAAFTIGAALINDKKQADMLDETVAKKVAEALKKQEN